MDHSPNCCYRCEYLFPTNKVCPECGLSKIESDMMWRSDTVRSREMKEGGDWWSTWVGTAVVLTWIAVIIRFVQVVQAPADPSLWVNVALCFGVASGHSLLLKWWVGFDWLITRKAFVKVAFFTLANWLLAGAGLLLFGRSIDW